MKLAITTRLGSSRSRLGRERINKFFDSQNTFFDWKDSSEGIVYSVIENEQKKKTKLSLKEFDAVYINTLGPLIGYETKFLDFINDLKNLNGTTVINNPYTIENNLDKKYLLELQKKSIPVIPTIEIQNTYSKTKINQELKKLTGESFDEVILKPKYFSERSEAVIKMNEFTGNLNKYLTSLNDKGVIAQPYIENSKNGERSLIFIGEEYSHAALRTRPDWKPMGRSEIIRITPSKEEMNLAEKVINEYDAIKHITRIDFIGERTIPLLSELEMINPATYYNREEHEGIARDYLPKLMNYFKSLQ